MLNRSHHQDITVKGALDKPKYKIIMLKAALVIRTIHKNKHISLTIVNTRS
jgi:hypothetical protein